MSTLNSGFDPRPEASLQPGDGVIAILSPDSTSLGPNDASASASPPLVGTNSLEVPGDKVASEGKRKQEDDSDTALDAVDASGTRKKLKLEASDVEEVLLVRPAEAVSGTEAAVESPANNAELPASLGLDDESAHTGSGTAVSTLPGVPPTPTVPSNPPSSPISLRSLSAPPTSPIVTSVTHGPRPPEPEPLHTYACPICFASPTNATLTPCGHIMCGECLFTAVGAAVARMGIASLAARCPVCRAPIPMWDGRGGGVIGLQPRVVITI